MNNQEPKPEIGAIVILVAFIAIAATFVYLYVSRPLPPYNPPKQIKFNIDVDLSSRNIGNKIGKQTAEFTKGFVRGVLGKDKDGE